MSGEELITIHKDQGDSPVSHKELADFLQIDSRTVERYLIGERANYGFTASTDFYVHLDVNPSPGRPAKIYWLTINTAKEISMLSGSPRGKLARQYFLKCEQVARASNQIPQSFADALRLAADQADQIEAQARRLAIAEPKAAVADRIANSDGLITVSEFARTVEAHPQKIVRQWLLKQGYIYSVGRYQYRAYETYLKRGLFSHIVSSHPDGNGGERLCTTIKLTGKGLAYLTCKWNQAQLSEGF